MTSSIRDLRKIAVKNILRKDRADYLLRHALCKPWHASTHLDELAWTDFKNLFFNFPKLHANMDAWEAKESQVLDPGDRTMTVLAALCHEILHVLWLHKYRAKGKKREQWKHACEYAINYELGSIFGTAWIQHLNVMYPSSSLLKLLRSSHLPATTDGFYQVLCDNETTSDHSQTNHDTCRFCDRCDQEDDAGAEDESLVKHTHQVVRQLPEESLERKDILKFLVAEQRAAQKIPWEVLLMGGIEDAVTKELTWMRPSRRDDMLPSWQHEKLLTFVWILDVSPSIDDEMKRSFMNTLQAGINLYHDAQHRVIFFAEGVVDDIMVYSGTNLSQMEIPCGYGTDLDEVWNILERDAPEYALVLTDLELSPVPKPSRTKIVWGIVGNNRCFDPDYGVKIVLK